MSETSSDAPEQPETLTITLRKPVIFATVPYEKLDLREPTAHEWEMWDSLTGVAANIKAVATVSGIPEGAVRQVGVSDLTAAMRYLNGFF